MVVKEGSNKSYLSMVIHHQTILEYSIINGQIIHSFITDTYISIFELALLKCLIYGNDYLVFYNNMVQEENLAYM